jgi:hypothetical protein
MVEIHSGSPGSLVWLIITGGRGTSLKALFGLNKRPGWGTTPSRATTTTDAKPRGYGWVSACCIATAYMDVLGNNLADSFGFALCESEPVDNEAIE